MNQPIKSKVEGEIWKMKPLLSRDFKSYVTGPGPARARLRREPPRIRGMRLSWRNTWSHRPHSVALYILYMHSYIIISHVVHVLWKIGLFTKTRPLSVSCQIFQRIERFSPAPKTPGRDSGGKASMWIMAIAAWWCPDQTLRACFQASTVEPTIDIFRSCFRLRFFSEAVATAPEYVDDGAAAHRWLHRACSCSAWDKWRISKWQRHRTAFTALKSHASKFDKLTPCFKSLEVFMVHWSYSTQSIQ